ELARPASVDHDAAAARVGRPARLPRTDELLGATGVFRPAADDSAGDRAAAEAKAVALRRHRSPRNLDLLWRQRLAESALLALPLLLADVAYQTWDSPEVGPAEAEGHALEALAPRVPAAPAPRRVAVLLDWGEMNDATYLRGWEGITGYGPSPLQRVLHLFEA